MCPNPHFSTSRNVIENVDKCVQIHICPQSCKQEVDKCVQIHICPHQPMRVKSVDKCVQRICPHWTVRKVKMDKCVWIHICPHPNIRMTKVSWSLHFHKWPQHKTIKLNGQTEWLSAINAVDTSNQKYMPLSTNLWLKQKRRMLYFPMDFGELTIDGLIDTGAPTPSTQEPLILQSDLRVKPNEIIMVDMNTNKHHEHNVTGIVQPTKAYDGHDVLLVCPAIVTLTNQVVRLTVNNTSSLPCAIPKGTHLATFSVLSPSEHRELRPGESNGIELLEC